MTIGGAAAAALPDSRPVRVAAKTSTKPAAKPLTRRPIEILRVGTRQ
jgi:hypothetical protein